MQVVLALVIVLVAALVICVARALMLRPAQPKGAPIDAGGYAAGDDAVERFRTLLRIPTVSRDDPVLLDHSSFDQWIPMLRELYPKTLATLELTRIDDYGILMRWAGADATRGPVLLMAHHDVVPTEGQDWTYPPFAAEIHEGRIWARGTTDNKCCFAAIMEAFETLLGMGYVPPRDVWFFSSCREETSCSTADHAAAWLADHDIHPAMVLDEGGAVATGVPLGVTVPMAMVGVSEKGHVDLTVRATSAGGHASAPSDNDAPHLLVRAVERICSHPGKPYVDVAVRDMLAELASRGPFVYRLVFANMWLFRPLVGRILASGHETGPLVRTTYALTQLEGATTRNVLPPEAQANLNVRVAPFETVERALARALSLADTEADASGAPGSLTVGVAENSLFNEPAPLSPHDDAAFDYIRCCVAGIYPEAGCCPYVQTSCSDARSMSVVCTRVYRLAPFLYTPEMRSRIHGTDEYIPIECYKRGIAFYMAFVRALDELGA